MFLDIRDSNSPGPIKVGLKASVQRETTNKNGTSLLLSQVRFY